MASYSHARREQLARDAGFRSYREQRAYVEAQRDQEAGRPRESRQLRGVDVSSAGTSADGPPMRQSTLLGLLNRAAAVMGRDEPVRLSIVPAFLTTSGGGYGLLHDDEVDVSLDGQREDDGTWTSEPPTLGDLIDALEDDTDDGLVSLVLATKGIEDAEGPVESFHLTIPGYFGG